MGSSTNSTLALGSCDAALFRAAGEAFRELCQGTRATFCSPECGKALAFLQRHLSTCAFSSVLRMDAVADVQRVHASPECGPAVVKRKTQIDSSSSVGQPLKLGATGAGAAGAAMEEMSEEEKVALVKQRVEEAREKNRIKIEEHAAKSEAARKMTLEAERKMAEQMEALARDEQERVEEAQREEQETREEAAEEAAEEA